MLTHRKNWCRVCGICLTCPRTNRSTFQRGSCHCIEKQANHVSPSRVKGEMLFSFRYRHLSAEDIDILEELRPRFRFITPPIERNLVRANVCSTCQQRLRRARIGRRRNQAAMAQSNSALNPAASEAETSENESNVTIAPSRHRHQHQSTHSFGNMLNSSMRSTLPSAAQSASWMIGEQLHPRQQVFAPAADVSRGYASEYLARPNMIEAAEIELSDFPSKQVRSPVSSNMAALLRQLSPAQHAFAQNIPAMQPDASAFPDNGSAESFSGELDDTRVDLEDAGRFEQNKDSKLPPIIPLSRPQSPLPLLPPPHMLIPAHQSRNLTADYVCNGNFGAGNATLPTQSMQPNIEFRDAADAVLFRETISTDYSFEDIFMQYYPDSPRSLLFYIHNNVALPRRSTLNSVFSQYNVDQLPVVIWAKMPVASDPSLKPQWQIIT